MKFFRDLSFCSIFSSSIFEIFCSICTRASISRPELMAWARSCLSLLSSGLPFLFSFLQNSIVRTLHFIKINSWRFLGLSSQGRSKSSSMVGSTVRRMPIVSLRLLIFSIIVSGGSGVPSNSITFFSNFILVSIRAVSNSVLEILSVLGGSVVHEIIESFISFLISVW